MNKKSQALLAVLLVFIIVVIDQIIKIEVKTTMSLHDSHHIADWFYITFIENDGMAYGMSFIPKIALTLFRLVAICVGSWYIMRIIGRGTRTLFVILASMVLAGALGNLIDCMFYGLIFSESTPFNIAQFVDFGDGYAPFFKGRVVDMFYFPIIDTNYPDWFPLWGGERFIFFSPVFNFADASISVGVVALLLFCRKELESIGIQIGLTEKKETANEEEESLEKDSEETAEK